MKRIFTFLILLILCSFTNAQWVNTGTLHSGTISINGLAASGNNIFAGTTSYGVYRSTNNGTNWSQVLPSKSVNTVIFNGTNIFAGTYGYGIFRSTNNGANWTQVNSYLGNLYVWSFAVCGSKIYAGTMNGVNVSSDTGSSWAQVINGLNNVYADIYGIDVMGTNIFAGGYGVYSMSNSGPYWWTQVSNGITSTPINSLVVSGANVIVGTSYGIFLSTNKGTNWTNVDSLTGQHVYTLTTSGNNVFAGTQYKGVYLSKDNGVNWTTINDGLTSTYASALSVSSTYVYVATSKGVWKRPLSEITDVTSDVNKLQNEYVLSQNYPNPFNPSTTINYSLPKAGNVILTVYNSIGSKVATIVNEYKPAGNYSVQFNASSAAGGLASGIYFYRLESGNYTAAKKLILIN
jgi:hypothetical protein